MQKHTDPGLECKTESPWGYGRLRERAPTQCFPQEMVEGGCLKQRREVATRLADYTEERLQDLIQEVLTGVTIQG